jgi:hypothetical protein
LKQLARAFLSIGIGLSLAPAIAAAQTADPGNPPAGETPPPDGETPPAAETPAEPAAPATGASAVQSLNPDISFIADVAAAWFSAKPPLESGEHDPRNNGFTLQQLELAASSAVDPYFRFDSFIVFKLPRPPAAGQPIGTGESGGVEIEEVYATTTSLPANLQLRVGQFLTRFGRFNPTHPHTWDFVDQPLEIGRLFSPDGNRGLGLELSYLTPLPWYVELVGSVTQDSEVDVSHWGNLQATVALKQFFSPSDDWSLMWGLSGIAGSDPSQPADPDGRSQIGGTDVYLKYRPLSGGSYTIVSLQAEWFYRRRDVLLAPATTARETLHDTGGFAALFWRFAQRWAGAARWELGTPSRTGAGVVTPHCGLDNPMCIDSAFIDNVQRVSANLTFWPTEFSRIRLQSAAALPGGGQDTEWSVMTAFEFAVGAHGAHAF